MCGIAGIVYQEGRPAEAAGIAAMTDALAARGPDGRGTVELDSGRAHLGHRRLSIIDLSEAGAQPMANEDGSVQLTFNGEIYNYRELRRELEALGHVFRSHTDSETVVHAYEQWGADCVRRFRGIFAFGIYDVPRRRLFLARDHLGVKPLFYHEGPGSFAFASQVRALLQVPGFRREVDPAAFSLYLAYGNVPEEHGIFAGLHKLPPGHWLELADGRVRRERYWAPQYRPTVHHPGEARDLVRTRMAEAVRVQSVSDVPVGSLLSGGVDSTIVTSLLAQGTPDRLATFTVGFDVAAKDERVHAREVSAHLGCFHHETVLDYGAACASITGIVEAMDEPFHLNGLFSYWAVSRLVADHGMKVVLGGDGADELFAGYRWYDSLQAEVDREARHGAGLRGRLLGTLRKRPSFDLPRAFFPSNGHFGAAAQQAIAGRTLGTIRDEHVLGPLRRAWPEMMPPVLAAQFCDMQRFMVDHCLTKVDRMSMACGVEVRVPFLDVDLVEAVLTVDHTIVFARGERKALLKEAFSDLFPPVLDTGRKKGFSSPMKQWLERGMARAGGELLWEGALVSHGLLNGARLRERFDGLRQGEQVTLISAELWARHWIDGDHQAARTFQEGLLANEHL